MLREALTYPARGEDAEETLLVGAILSLSVGVLARLGVLAVLALVPAAVLAGYALAVVRESLAGEDAPPRFSDLPVLARDGALALVVAAGYLLVPTVVLGITVGGASGGPRPETLGTTAFVLGAGTVVLFVAAAFAYLLPAALTGVARTGSLRAALDAARLRRTVGRGRYFVAWVTALMVTGAAGLVLGWLASLGRPGQVVALALGFYALVVVARLLGRGAG